MNQMLQDRGSRLRGSPWLCKELLKLSAGKDLRMHWVQQDTDSTALPKDFEEARFIRLALACVKIKWKGNRENEECGLPAYQVATNSPKQMKPSSPAHACSDMLRAAHVNSCMYILHVYKENPQNCGCIVTEKNPHFPSHSPFVHPAVFDLLPHHTTFGSPRPLKLPLHSSLFP